MMAGRCQQQVYQRVGSFRGHQCLKAATVDRDGISYCTQHDPERIKADNATRSGRWIEAANQKAESIRVMQENSQIGRWLRDNRPNEFFEIRREIDGK